MRTFILPALALAAILPAQTGQQVDVTLATADAAGVHANRQIDAVRPGTVVDRALLLEARDGRETSAASLARRDTMGMHNRSASGAVFAWHGSAAAGEIAGTLGGNPLAAGPQQYAMVLQSRAGVTGDIVILFEGAGRNGATANAAVAVGSQGHRFVADGTMQRATIADVTVGGRGLRVDIRFAGQASGPRGQVAAFHAGLKVYFVPDSGGGGGTCEVLPGQRSCPEGGVLQGRIDTSGRMPVLHLGLQGALPNAIGLTIVSPTGRTFPILNTNCIFFANPIVHATFQTDANGNARDQITFPMRTGGFFVQQASILLSPRGFRFGTSNTLEVRCH